MKKFLKKSVKFQFTSIIIVWGVVFFSIISIMSVNIIHLTKTKQNLYINTAVTDFNNKINSVNKEVEGIFQNLQYDSDVITYLSAEHDSNYMNILSVINKKASLFYSSNSKIVELALVTKKSSNSLLLNPKILRELQSKISPFGISYLGAQNYNPDPDYTSQKKLLLLFGVNVYDYTKNNVDEQDVLGSIIIGYKIDDFYSKSFYKEQGDLSFYLFDRNQIYPINVLESQDQISINKDQLNKYINNSIDSVNVNNRNEMYYIDYVKPLDTYLITSISRHMLIKDLATTSIPIILISLFSIVTLFITYKIISLGVIKPLNKFYQHISEGWQQGVDFLKGSIKIEGNKEIMTFVQEFNSMMKEIDRLTNDLLETMSKLYEAEMEKNKAEIAYLRSQINPHFLYNTLETIKGIAIENNVPQIPQITTAMGKMYRYSIKGSPTVTLKEEIEIVKAYLTIQKARFNDSFDIIYNFDKDILDFQVLKMILQPLAENAVFHGLEKKTDHGLLYLGGQVSNGNLILTIQDDGFGMSKEELYNINCHLKAITKVQDDFTREHTGIINTSNRIKLAYGEQYGLYYESSENTGTKLLVTLPPLKNQKGEI
ncbi:histidine kinase [Clostridium swellfunianum]|uniref:sensor histidine kinase n=1 Tax=Clostridium swellfunianum TaxID=1367462 RepID=UPI00202EC5BF|nr:histidine kinase [Clostridium swellfunianum]MCM0646855.1 histidine kinase [Clostridium swellfunianum]